MVKLRVRKKVFSTIRKRFLKRVPTIKLKLNEKSLTDLQCTIFFRCERTGPKLKFKITRERARSCNTDEPVRKERRIYRRITV